MRPAESPRLPPWLPAAFLAAALTAAWWRSPMPAPAAFAVPAAASGPSASIPMQATLLPQVAATAAAPSLAELPNGRIACAWLADDRDNVAVWFSLTEKDGWRQPARIATRESTAGAGFARADRIESPLLHAEGNWLHLWYVSTAIGDAAGHALQHSQSTDGGRSWTRPLRLATSPWPFAGTRLAGPPVALDDGGLALPVSYRFIGERAGWLRLSATGQLLDQPRLGDGSGSLPAVAALDSRLALAVFAGAGQPVSAVSTNGGLSWQPGAALPLAAADAPLALLRLRSGRLLLAGNTGDQRQTLQLWLSDDAGQNWRLARVAESADDGGAEFAQPALLQGRDGRIHLAYAWRRQTVRHMVFGENWLNGGDE